MQYMAQVSPAAFINGQKLPPYLLVANKEKPFFTILIIPLFRYITKPVVADTF